MATHVKEIKVRPLEGSGTSRLNASKKQQPLSKNSEDADLRRVLIEEDTVNIKNMKHQQTSEASSTVKTSKPSGMSTVTIVVLSIIVIMLVVLVAWMVMRENKKKIDSVQESIKTNKIIEKLSGQVNTLQNKYINRESVIPPESNQALGLNTKPKSNIDDEVENTLKEKVYPTEYIDVIPEEDGLPEVPPNGIPEESPSDDDLNQLILDSE
jgi:hypothetical protein